MANANRRVNSISSVVGEGETVEDPSMISIVLWIFIAPCMRSLVLGGSMSRGIIKSQMVPLLEVGSRSSS